MTGTAAKAWWLQSRSWCELSCIHVVGGLLVLLSTWSQQIAAQHLIIDEADLTRLEGNTLLRRTGSGLGKANHAPYWLQQDAPGLYFPLTRHIPQDGGERGRKLAGDGEVSWGLLGSSNQAPLAFYTTVALGSQNQLFNVLVDTYDSLFWVQCECEQCAQPGPASATSPVAIHEPFDASSSTTAVNTSCNSTSCTLYSAYNATNFGCHASHSTNGDGYCQFVSDSEVSGRIIEDQISLTLTNGTTAEPSITFGCGSSRPLTSINSSSTYVFDGRLGLGRDNYSLVKQLATSQISSNSFSLCLDGSGVLSHLLIGRTNLASGAVYSALSEETSSLWATNLVSISVNGSSVNVTRDVAIDASQPVTFLPSNLFVDVFTEVLQQGLPEDYQQALICTAQRGELTVEMLNVLFPPLMLSFTSAEDPTALVNFTVTPAKYFNIQYNMTGNTTNICLNAVASDQYAVPTIGSGWLQNVDILFDETNGRIGWLPTNCTTGESLTRAPGPTGAPEYTFPPSTTPPADLPSALTGDASQPPPPPPLQGHGVSRHPMPTYAASLVTFSLVLLFHCLTK